MFAALYSSVPPPLPHVRVHRRFASHGRRIGRMHVIGTSALRRILDPNQKVLGQDQIYGAGTVLRLDASQPNGQANVRFGSKADIPQCKSDVRFTPKSGHRVSVSC
jgi:hypothetical protein